MPSAAVLKEHSRVRALYKTLGLPLKGCAGLTLSEAKACGLAWLNSPAGRQHALRRRTNRSWVRCSARVRHRHKQDREDGVEGPSRWALVRAAVRQRAIAFWWWEATVRSLCAPDATYRLADLEAYAMEFCADDWFSQEMHHAMNMAA